MKVLIACEESQRVCIEFRKQGHEAFSCDTQPCSGGHPKWHIQGDVLPVLADHWDMIIAFPPCTDLSCACAHLWPQKSADGRQQAAFDFVQKIWQSNERVCIENQQGWLNTNWSPPTQVIQPFYFGDPYIKRTCLWLKNLPPLGYRLRDDLFGKKTAVAPKSYWASSSNRPPGYLKNGVQSDAKNRSKTFPGIAKAMADHWGSCSL